MVDMTVSRLAVDPLSELPIVILKDEKGTEALPIWVGVQEASAIACELDQIALDRPATHDLMKSLLGACDVAVDRIEVHDLREQVFYATVHLRGPDGRERTVDARPSDAIALALRAGARIRVARKVVERARRPVGALGEESSAAERDAEMALLLCSLPKGAFGKWKM